MRVKLTPALLLLVLVAAIMLALAGADPGGPAHMTVRVGGPAPAPPVPQSFVGLSMEYQAAGDYTGSDPANVDPVFEQLIRNLNPGQAPVLRIGGDSTDHTWYPVAGVRPGPGVYNRITPSWLAGVSALARDLDARIIFGIDLEADSQTLAEAEAQALLGAVGRAHLLALEIGNEPDLYSTNTWYTGPGGRSVKGRPRSYDLASYLSDFGRLRSALPPVPLAGPAVGDLSWMGGLDRLLRAEPSLSEVTFHSYPLNRCAPQGAARSPTIRKLLSARDSDGLARVVAPYAALARARGVGFRVDELGSVACAGRFGVSDTFASSLWMLDSLFAMARAGVSGVNVHTFPQAAYEPFTVSRRGSRWTASVRPDYYGMLMFVQAAPPGSRLLRVGTGSRAVRAWATSGPGKVKRVVLINTSQSSSVDVTIHVAGSTRAGRLERLLAPSARATSGTTLGGRSFGSSTASGRLVGAPVTAPVTATDGGYAVTLPAASAALLTIP